MGDIWSWFVGLLEWVLLEAAILTGNTGLGIMLFTLVARVMILPLALTSIRSSRRMQEMEPMRRELQRKYGNDQRKLQEETMKLYREYKINPAGSCLPIIFQLPIFFGVYQAVIHLMVPDQQAFLSDTVKNTLADPVVRELFMRPFLGILELGKATWDKGVFSGFIYLILPVLSIGFQLVQQLMATPRVQDPQQRAMTQAMMVMPLVFGYIAFTFPSGAVLYWVTSSVIGIVQQYFTSGWGSLANYLPLPPDGRTTSSVSARLTGSAVSALPSGKQAETQTQRAEFWDVLRPLVDLDVADGPTEDRSGSASAERSLDEVRRQGRYQQNPRRQHRRR